MAPWLAVPSCFLPAGLSPPELTPGEEAALKVHRKEAREEARQASNKKQKEKRDARPEEKEALRRQPEAARRRRARRAGTP